MPEFTQLISAHQLVIYKVLHTYCRDLQEHDDLRQEILKELWLSYPKWEGRCSFSTYVYNIARNVAVNRLRALKKQIHTVGLHNIFYDIIDNQEAPPPEISLSILSETDKEMLILYAEGTPYDKMSTVMGMTANGCAVRILRIKRKLQEYYRFRE